MVNNHFSNQLNLQVCTKTSAKKVYTKKPIWIEKPDFSDFQQQGPYDFFKYLYLSQVLGLIVLSLVKLTIIVPTFF